MAVAAGKTSPGRVLAGVRDTWAARSGLSRPGTLFAAALETEWEERRLFLWLPVAAGGGVLLYLAADQEPVLWLPLALAFGAGLMAVVVRHRPVPFCLAVGLLAVCGGFVSAELRS